MSDPKTPTEILEALGKPFPKSALKQRAGGGGKPFTYVETHTVIHRLNSATNGDWTFHVRDTQWRDDLLIVLGELTIPGLGTRSGFGVQKVSARGGEDLVKGAVSDALKKAATLFGVALDLYGVDYEDMPQAAPQRVQKPASATRPAATIPDAAPRNERTTDAMKRLHAVGNAKGIDHDGLRMLVIAKATKSGLSIASLNEAPGALLSEAADAIEADAPKILAWLEKQRTEQAPLMPWIDEVPNPERFTR